MKCPFCGEGKAIQTNTDYVTPEGVHLGPTFRCDNLICLFYGEERDDE